MAVNILPLGWGAHRRDDLGHLTMPPTPGWRHLRFSLIGTSTAGGPVRGVGGYERDYSAIIGTGSVLLLAIALSNSWHSSSPTIPNQASVGRESLVGRSTFCSSAISG